MADTKLNQAWFARTFAEDINRFNLMYLQARPVLVDCHEVPKEMSEEDWNRVVDALSRCYQSVKCLFEIAMLAESKIISNDVLCILYYDEITGYLTEKLNYLIRWCGTGLDLAADYDSYKLARIANSLVNLVQKLDAINQKHGVDLEAEVNRAYITRFKEEAKEFFCDPGRFSVLSENYVSNYVSVKE
jgi:hypothetical protein